MFSRLATYFLVPFYAHENAQTFQRWFPWFVSWFWKTAEKNLRAAYIDEIQPEGPLVMDIY
jgi:hypothetical protein